MLSLCIIKELQITYKGIAFRASYLVESQFVPWSGSGGYFQIPSIWLNYFATISLWRSSWSLRFPILTHLCLRGSFFWNHTYISDFTNLLLSPFGRNVILHLKNNMAEIYLVFRLWTISPQVIQSTRPSKTPSVIMIINTGDRWSLTI